MNSYLSKYKGQEKQTITFRLPVEQLAWLDVLVQKRVGSSRNEVVQVLIDVARESLQAKGLIHGD